MNAPTAPQVYEAIAAVSAKLAQTGISKDRKNQQQGFSFRGIDDVYNALAPILAEHRLVIIPRILSREVVERTSKSGSAQFYVTVEAEFDFIAAADGSKVTARTYGEAQDSGDKATNKAMSAAYKYAAFQTFCIPTEGDHDSDAQTPEPVKPAALTAPEGYDQWWSDMVATADTGLDALAAAFKASPKPFAAYMNQTNRSGWDALKAKAAKVAA